MILHDNNDFYMSATGFIMISCLFKLIESSSLARRLLYYDSTEKITRYNEIIRVFKIYIFNLVSIDVILLQHYASLHVGEVK